MPKQEIYEYSVLFHHKIEKDNAGNDITKDSIIVINPSTMLAPNVETVSKKVARMIPKEYEDRLNQCDIIVRPF